MKRSFLNLLTFSAVTALVGNGRLRFGRTFFKTEGVGHVKYPFTAQELAKIDKLGGRAKKDRVRELKNKYAAQRCEALTLKLEGKYGIKSKIQRA